MQIEDGREARRHRLQYPSIPTYFLQLRLFFISFLAPHSSFRLCADQNLKLRSLSELVTTNIDEKAMAPAASIGLSKPNAAAGIKITL
jgi:hypothetical protein